MRFDFGLLKRLRHGHGQIQIFENRFIPTTNSHLTQTEADALLALYKHRTDEIEWDYPALGGQIAIPLISADR